MLRRGSLALLLASALFASVRPSPASAANCQFVLGFAALHNLIPDIVGECLSNEYHNPDNGDGLQQTTRGLLVWRRADNYTAFTDGTSTWVSGPYGVQKRPNDQRFAWEANPENLPIVGQVWSAVGQPPAANHCPTAGLSLSASIVDNGDGTRRALLSVTNRQAEPCVLVGFAHVELTDAGDQPMPTNIVPRSSQPPAPVVLSAGSSAIFTVDWRSDADCPTASALKVTPPGEQSSLTVSIPMAACDGVPLDLSPFAPSTSLSHNWSGYTAIGASYTSVTGTWTVPATRNANGAIAIWVGIGGLQSKDLIQAGTLSLGDGVSIVQHRAFIEMLPETARPVDVTVSPGDSITASISRAGADEWLITLTNNTTRQYYQTSVHYSSSMSSVEWVVEAPSNAQGAMPLGSFGTIQFTNAKAANGDRNLTIAGLGAQPITMLAPDGKTTTESSPLGGDGCSFTVTQLR